MLATRALRAASSASTIASAASSAASLSRAKTTTDLTGLAVHPEPLTALNDTYTKTLSFLDTLPQGSVYKQAAHAVTSDRLNKLESVRKMHSSNINSGDAKKVEEAIQDLEQQIDAGQIEEVVIQAQDELKLAAKMVEWKSHEPLEVAPQPGQWSYFDMAEEASTNEG